MRTERSGGRTLHGKVQPQHVIAGNPGTIGSRPDRVQWFDLERGLLHVRASDTFRPKDREARTIPLTSEFHQFLKHFGLRSPFLLHPEVPHGKSRYRWDFRRPWKNYIKAQGLGWVTPHVMRHTFASLLASKGVSIYKIALWLGDDVRVVQKHYAKLLPKDEDIESAFRSERKIRRGETTNAK